MPFVAAPLLTGQSESGHPFFIGEKAQTSRSKSIWVDPRGRIRRRPRLFYLADVPRWNLVTGFFKYQYKSRGSRSADILLAAHQPDYDGIFGAFDKPAISVFSSNVQTEHSDSTALTKHASRFVGRSVTSVWEGTRFQFDEKVSIYTGSTTEDDGSLWTGQEARVLADNVDFNAEDGTIVIRLDGIALLAGTTNVRILGQTSGANVTFATFTEIDRVKHVWQADANGDSFQYAVPSFAQYGRFMFATDDTGLRPLVSWSGGIAEGRYLPQAPVGAVLAVHDNRLWLGNLSRNGSEVVGSELGNPFGWNFDRVREHDPVSITFETDDRDDVAAISSSPQGDLLVWKTGSTHRIVGFIRNPPIGATREEYARTVISRKIGCAAHATVQQVGDDTLWMSHVGVHSLLATDKYGDLESAYLSDSISEIWREIPPGFLKLAQAAVHPRLGQYLLGISTGASRFLNKLLSYNVATQQWMTWDIGEFTAIGVGPGVGGEKEAIYVNLIRDEVVGTTYTDASVMAVLDFSDSGTEDFNMMIANMENIAIDVVLEPGDLFSMVDPEVRSSTKQGKYLHFYLAPSGKFESDIKYSWDGGEEFPAVLDHNPTKKPVYGAGARLGSPGGVLLSSKNDTRFMSIPMKGQGRMARFRIEDSNVGRLPHLHVDVEFEAAAMRRATPFEAKR